MFWVWLEDNIQALFLYILTHLRLHNIIIYWIAAATVHHHPFESIWTANLTIYVFLRQFIGCLNSFGVHNRIWLFIQNKKKIVKDNTVRPTVNERILKYLVFVFVVRKKCKTRTIASEKLKYKNAPFFLYSIKNVFIQKCDYICCVVNRDIKLLVAS